MHPTPLANSKNKQLLYQSLFKIIKICHMVVFYHSVITYLLVDQETFACVWSNLKGEGNCQFFQPLKTTLKTNKSSPICYFGTPAEQ